MKEIRINPETYHYYPLEVAGVKRNLPICKVSDELYIGAFVIFGDVELTVKSAEALSKIMPEHDVIITAEAKGIPLICELARTNNAERYIVARKAPKLYMKDPISVVVRSITTAALQVLYLDKSDADYMKGKRVVIVDDVISTGESLNAIEKLVEEAGGNIVAKMSILAEGDAIDRKDITYLEDLPLFIPEK
ncbi:MAG: adenine phosphoribosyltransferase [Clostridiales bacterium]|nr:adenine phosphoribosyltransferase [Candidatus Coliplasma equi]